MEQVTQTRTSVKTAGVQKPAAAVSSVFDTPPMPLSEKAAVKPARRPHVRGPVVDPAEVEIRTYVPLPPGPGPSSAHLCASQRLLDRMPPGASCLLPPSQAKALMRYANKRRIKLATRSMPGGLTGVWRLEG